MTRTPFATATITPEMIQDGIDRAHRERAAFIKRMFSSLRARFAGSPVPTGCSAHAA